MDIAASHNVPKTGQKSGSEEVDCSACDVTMTQPPAADCRTSFSSSFGQRVLLTVDTEEEFNWDAPFTRDEHGVEHVAALERFQEFCERIGAHPLYLVDWPIANDPRAVEIIGDAIKRGTADIGAQLHPWVNPPFDEALNQHNSYVGHLPKEIEREKLFRLRDRIEEAFKATPLSYRAGRYGLGPNSAGILKSAGFKVDTSVRALFDYTEQEGPDYSNHPLFPYWVDDERDLLELPLTTAYWGPLRQLGPQIHRAQRHMPTLFAGFSKFKLLERIPLTPEGITAEEAIRGCDIAIDQNLPLLVLSFHSPSLAAGYTPYAQSQQEVEALYSWFETVYAHLSRRQIASTNVAEIIANAEN